MNKKEWDIIKEFSGGVRSGKTQTKDIIIHNLQEENRVLKKAFRNLIEEYITITNFINGNSLIVDKKEIDEDFDDRIQQAKESEKDEYIDN